MQPYEHGNSSFNALTNYLELIYGSKNVIGETPGGDCRIHIKISPEIAKQKLKQANIFKSDVFEDIPLVESVEYNSNENWVRIDHR